MSIVEILIRQAHPGGDEGRYWTMAQKLEDARQYQQCEAITWPVAVDDLEGTVHQVYGGLADPTYLIDVDGRVSYYNMWTYAPALHQAVEALIARGGSGVVRGGWDRAVRPLPALTEGWRAIRRGLPDSASDLDRLSPGAGALMRLGYKLRPTLQLLSQRSEPVPTWAKLALAVGAALLLARRRR